MLGRPPPPHEGGVPPREGRLDEQKGHYNVYKYGIITYKQVFFLYFSARSGGEQYTRPGGIMANPITGTELFIGGLFSTNESKQTGEQLFSGGVFRSVAAGEGQEIVAFWNHYLNMHNKGGQGIPL